MDPAADVLLAALAERGEAQFLEHARGSVSGHAMVAGVKAAGEEATKLSVAFEPGDVVALHGRHHALSIFAPLAAWSRGLCTHLVGARETTSSVDGLLAQSGARMVLTWKPPGIYGGWPLAGPRRVPLPTGTLLATSGSQGRPKLVLHALEKHIESARAAGAFLGLSATDRLLLSLPTWHVGGLSLLFRAILSGAVLCEPGAGTELPEALQQYAPTHVSLVATQLKRLLEDDESLARLRACRAVLLGGGPAPVALRERALDAGVPLVVSYGATETAAFVAASADPNIVRREDSAGTPLPGREIVIDDDGQIRVGGPTLLDGYVGPEGLVSALDAEGRWPTGDLGRLDEGVLHVSGRADRMFITGGENVQPEDIEEALLAIDAVAEAVVVPVPHEDYGLRPVAFVAGDGLSAAALDTALRAVLPGFKTPDVYYRMPERTADRLKPDIGRLTALAADALAASGLEKL